MELWKISFLALSLPYYILHWNAKDICVSPLRLVHSSSRTSEDLKLDSWCSSLPLAPFFKLPNFTVCVVRWRAAMLPPALSDPLQFWTSSLTGQAVQFYWTARRFKPSRATKSGAKSSRGGVSRPPLKRQQWLAALSWTPQGQQGPGASLSQGGSWYSFISLFLTSVQNLEHWIQTWKNKENRYPEILWDSVVLQQTWTSLGCLLQPNSLVFVKEALWTTLDVP